MCTVQLIWLFWYWWTAVYPNSSIPGNWINDEENSCYPNSSIPGNVWYWFIFSLHVHHVHAQNIWIHWIVLYCILYSNPQDGGGGQFFFQFRASPLGSDLPEFFYIWGIFSCNFYAATRILFIAYLNFFSDIKRVQYRTVKYFSAMTTVSQLE